MSFQTQTSMFPSGVQAIINQYIIILDCGNIVQNSIKAIEKAGNLNLFSLYRQLEAGNVIRIGFSHRTAFEIGVISKLITQEVTILLNKADDFEGDEHIINRNEYQLTYAYGHSWWNINGWDPSDNLLWILMT
jgi:hypothetical protein